MSATIIFTDKAPRPMTGKTIQQLDAAPNVEELIQLTTALDMDVPQLRSLLRVNTAVQMLVGIYLSCRRQGIYVRAKDVLRLVPTEHFTTENDEPDEEDDDEPDPPTAPVTATAPGPDGSEQPSPTTPSPTA